MADPRPRQRISLDEQGKLLPIERAPLTAPILSICKHSASWRTTRELMPMADNTLKLPLLGGSSLIYSCSSPIANLKTFNLNAKLPECKSPAI